MRTCFALLIVGLFALDEHQPWSTVSAADHPELPANIIVDEPLTDLAFEMLRGSQTFRHQCQRLGMIRVLSVRVSLDLQRQWGRREYNARCRLMRYQYGRIEADVRLITLADAQSLIAHELEHVREYVEGMNFLATSVQYPRRVWITPQGHYETTRAIQAGDQVASEVSRHRSQLAAATLAQRDR